MKASLKFREERKPLLRAKLPVSVLGLPFLAGAAAGETADLRLDVTSAFSSGPSLRLSYRPNDSSNPFSVILRTGIGAFGSPASSPLTMTAEFNLSGVPSFVIRIKPRAGDFFLKKSVQSVAHGDHRPGVKYLPENAQFTTDSLSEDNLSLVNSQISGAEMRASSVLPLWRGALAKFHWGLRVPFSSDFRSIRKLPTLAMDKVSIEHRFKEEGAAKEKEKGKPDEEIFKRDLASLKEETAVLRKAVEELRARPPPAPPRRSWEGEKPVGRPSSFGRNDGDLKRKEASKDDVSEELRKAIAGAGAGL